MAILHPEIQESGGSNKMEHLILDFTHDIRDVMPYCNFIEKLKPLLQENEVGSYLGDDMAIDGGDAEAVFECRDARKLFEFISPYLQTIAFMRGAKVTLVFGDMNGGAESCSCDLG